MGAAKRVGRIHPDDYNNGNMPFFRSLKNILYILTFALLTVGFPGCASMDKASPYNMVTTEETPLLESGPHQSTPAGTTLAPGTRVRILSASGAFGYVETIRGEKGFVSMNSLQYRE